MSDQRLIVKAGSVATLDELGGKANALNALTQAGFPVPAWFVVTPAAFDASLSTAQHKLLSRHADDAIAQMHVEPAENVVMAIEAALATLAPDGQRLAVRSSAVDEDGFIHSYAGQLDSYLFVPASKVVEKVTAVWRSGFSTRLMKYRQQNRITTPMQAQAVLVQLMVEADSAGVAFSADPVSGRRNRCIVSAGLGLADTLVSGTAAADMFYVDGDDHISQREIAIKTHRQAADPQGGVASQPVAADVARQPALNDEQVCAIAALARRAEKYFARPQDIEWAYHAGDLYLLQSRPITTLIRQADPDGEITIWDNSNIVESYSGVTTPLTYTFIRHAYASVYLDLVRLLGVSEDTIAYNQAVFQNMLGLIKGRVYYNLLNWYRLLAMLPGFSLNRKFMDQMMGVKEELPPSFFDDFQTSGRFATVRELLRVCRTVFGMIRNHFQIEKTISAFYFRLDQSLSTPNIALDAMEADTLVRYYHQLERELLQRWDAPLINDLLAMIFYGLLRKLVAAWCEDENGTLQNNLLTGEGGMVSAEPAQRVLRMAQSVAEDGDFVRLLMEGDLAAIQAAMNKRPEFADQYKEYLERFGDRCLQELKIESLTLHDDPLLLLRSVGALASRKEMLSVSTSERDLLLRREAEAKIRRRLRFRPLRRWMFRWALKHARARVRDRENLRFERTRVFGQVRRIFLELGRRLYAMEAIEQPRDIFYLELQEIIGLIEGTATTLSFKQLISLRQQEYSGYRSEPSPDNRFVTRGGVHLGNAFISEREVSGSDHSDLRGIGCCPGIVRGIAHVITDPTSADLKPGEILIAEHTDPGWIMLFASAAGIVVERGSLLSHSAIVAREMNIPAVVAVDDVTRRIQSGDAIEVDGSTGHINIIQKRAADEA